MRKAGDEYATRAAAFRKLADELGNARERSALLAIADQYDAVARRLNEDEEAEAGEKSSRP